MSRLEKPGAEAPLTTNYNARYVWMISAVAALGVLGVQPAPVAAVQPAPAAAVEPAPAVEPAAPVEPAAE